MVRISGWDAWLVCRRCGLDTLKHPWDDEPGGHVAVFVNSKRSAAAKLGHARRMAAK